MKEPHRPVSRAVEPAGGPKFEANGPQLNAGLTAGLLLREEHGEGTAFGAGASQLDAPAMRADNPETYGETQPGAAAVRSGTRTDLIHAKETVEDPRLKIDGNSLPGIPHRDAILRILPIARDGNGATSRRVFDGVVQEIHDELADEFFVGAHRKFPCRFARQRNFPGGGERAEVARTFGDELVEVEIRQHQRMLAGVGASEGEQILDDVLETFGLSAQDAERFAIFSGLAALLRESDVRFPIEDGDRSAQLVRSVRNEAALLLERTVKAIQQLVERLGKMAELIGGVFYGEAFMQVLRSDAPGLRAHGNDRREAAAGQEVAASAGEQNRQRNHQGECSAERFEQFFLRAERLKNNQLVVAVESGKLLSVTPITQAAQSHNVKFSGNRTRIAGWLERRVQRTRRKARGAFGGGNEIVFAVEDQKNGVAKTMFGDGGLRGVADGAGFRGAAELRVNRSEKRISQLGNGAVCAMAQVIAHDEIRRQGESGEDAGEHHGVPQRQTNAHGTKHRRETARPFLVRRVRGRPKARNRNRDACAATVCPHRNRSCDGDD